MPANNWFEDEDLWVELYPFLFSADRWSAAAGEIEALLRLAPRPGDRVLDLCCGPGRHAIALAQQGLRVTGVDRTNFLLRKAEENAQAAGVQLELVREDMRRFRRPAAFDLIVSLYTSFGYFDDEDNQRVLYNVRDNLAPGGVVVFDVASKEGVAASFQETASATAPDGARAFKRHTVSDDWSRIDHQWTIVRGDRARSFEFTLRIFSGRELKDLLLATGFSRVQLFGELDGRPYDRNLRRLIAVARRD
jgi:SAM-dependent methyltransferase